jgi:hypothetical protein
MNKRQYKKQQKKLGLWEGQQYRGGRQAGRQNLKRTESGAILNQHGVTFTQEEKRAFESLVGKANRRRSKMIAEEAGLERKIAGKPTGQKLGELRLMGRENEFIIAKRSKSLQQFSSREAFDNSMKRMETLAADRDAYVDDRIRLYKRNYIESLRNVFGSAADGVAMKVRMMKPEDFRKLAESDEVVNIQFVYGNDPKQAKLNATRSALNMKQKDYDDFDAEEELPY